MPQFAVPRILRETFVRQVDYRPVVDSTNNLAAEWTKTGNPIFPLLVLADCQTAGRGRGTKRWWTDDGSLAFSVLINESWMPVPSSRLPLLGLAAGLAVLGPMQRLLPEHRAALLWPNDVSIDDRKICGILVETSGRRHAVIGIGANVNNSLCNAPTELQTLAVSASDLTGKQYDLTEILIEMLNRLENELSMLSQKNLGNRFPYNLPQNVPITIRCQDGILTGICRGIGSDETIILETASGTKSVLSFAFEPVQMP